MTLSRITGFGRALSKGHYSIPKNIKGDLAIWRLTLVPGFRSVKSSVVPAGTSIFESTIVAQDFFDAMADAQSLNVQVARLARSVSSGAAAGAADTAAAPNRRSPSVIKE